MLSQARARPGAGRTGILDRLRPSARTLRGRSFAPLARRPVGRSARQKRRPPLSRFPGVDFIEIDSLLTDEERLIRDTVRNFVHDRVKPIIEEHHRDGRFPMQLVPEMAQLNMFGATIDEYGLP